MKKNRLIALLAMVLCFAVLLPCCKLHRKVETTVTEEETEEETESESEATTSLAPSLMQVYSLDQFISDGSIFAENVPVPTATPIPVVQTALGLTNEDDGYYSGALENATVVDNEFFRYTIISVETTDEAYNLNVEFENKTDIPFSLFIMNPFIDGYSVQMTFITEVIEPHKVIADVISFEKEDFPLYDGREPTRVSFLIAPNPLDSNDTVYLSEIGGFKYTYAAVSLFPQGEDAFHYTDPDISDTSSIVYDTDGICLQFDSFEIGTDYFKINYTFVNKTNVYVMAYLKDGRITLDTTVFDTGYLQSMYVAPYGVYKSNFSVSLNDINNAGLVVGDVKTVSVPLYAKYLASDDSVLVDTDVKKEVTFG